ncbi:MAG TPA: acyl-CoA dehydrogenase family protein [Acidimicrobiales bacterium]|nr:acyl-CoA dehydrogenase family protein [Acidimicrobiales bacterium]
MTASPGPDPLEPAGLRAAVAEALTALLEPRRSGSRTTVLGAGNDDLEPGRRFLRTLSDGGYATPGWPVEHGGMGLDPAAAEVVLEVLSGFEAPDLYPFMIGLDLVGPTLLAHASAEQHRRWLDRIRTGEDIWCQLFSEPDAGSDLANLKARAGRDGDGWVLNGSKVWSSRAHYAQWGLLLARTDGSVPKHRGITAFGLDMTSPGITVRPLVQMNGDAHFNEVFFDDVRIPDADRIGEPGEGWRVAITCLSHERGALAGGLGVSPAQVVALARGPGMAGCDVRRDRAARDWATLRVLEWSGQRALAARRAGAVPGAEGSLAKLGTNGVLKDLASLGVEAQGPAGTLDPDEQWQSLLLLSPSISIRGGTDEIQRNIVGERVLGLPPEPRVDKDRPFDQRPDR